jgi:[1-hydroxy-2-(trimethylamino)ethyl]phosphonate dioxygenase
MPIGSDMLQPVFPHLASRTFSMPAETLIESIHDLFARKGTSLYGGEAVTQTEHALQAAMLAEQGGAPPASIAAALLHDIGHLLHDLPDNIAELGSDDVHEQLGYEWLCNHFPPEVSEPVRNHVDAKRYLCAVDRHYLDALSPASALSLSLQGGPMTPQECGAFEAGEFFKQSVELRRWDDQAKIPDLETPSLEHFLRYVGQVCCSGSIVEASR